MNNNVTQTIRQCFDIMKELIVVVFVFTCREVKENALAKRVRGGNQ